MLPICHAIHYLIQPPPPPPVGLEEAVESMGWYSIKSIGSPALVVSISTGSWAAHLGSVAVTTVYEMMTSVRFCGKTVKCSTPIPYTKTRKSVHLKQ